jgi:hypothetical protein
MHYFGCNLFILEEDYNLFMHQQPWGYKLENISGGSKREM